jgi:hypothetical protein
MKKAAVIFAAAALLLEKKAGGRLACPRLELSFSYAFLRRSYVNLRADLSNITIIIVVTKYAHFCLSSGNHRFLHTQIMEMPRSSFHVKRKVPGQ